MTLFQIVEDGQIIGFESYEQDGVCYWKSVKLTSRDKVNGKYPMNENCERKLVSEQVPNRREEKR